MARNRYMNLPLWTPENESNSTKIWDFVEKIWCFPDPEAAILPLELAHPLFVLFVSRTCCCVSGVVSVRVVPSRCVGCWVFVFVVLVVGFVLWVSCVLFCVVCGSLVWRWFPGGLVGVLVLVVWCRCVSCGFSGLCWFLSLCRSGWCLRRLALVVSICVILNRFSLFSHLLQVLPPISYLRFVKNESWTPLIPPLKSLSNESTYT